MKSKFLMMAEWVQAYWLALICFLTVLWSIFLFILGATWWITYVMNGLWGYKFDLNSCWQGVTVVGVALGSIFTLGKTAVGKYNADSQNNSAPGEMPTVLRGALPNQRD